MSPGYETSTDGELLSAARNGQKEAFRGLVDRHKDILVNYLTRLTGCHDRAEDLAQDAFVRLYSSADNYEDRGFLRAYLFRIATNLLRSEERRETRWRRLSPLLVNSNGHSTAPGEQEKELLENEIGDVVGRAIAALPLRYRAPLLLHEIQGWPYREIGLTLGCREGTVKSRIHRGRRLLRHGLEDYWRGGKS
ncbi:MAG: RNA polymerase sigma factor [Acidobacteriota bacterium]|nr:RNA polymerase sigma factor [Acidobacteriota bacterium]